MITQPVKSDKLSAKETNVLVSLLHTLLQYTNIDSAYETLVQAFLSKTHRTLHLPCCLKSKLSSFILYGTYVRKVWDIQPVYRNHKIEYELVQQPLKIQRILCVDCAHNHQKRTHALLLQLFVPYGRYSIRAILYFLNEYFTNYCANVSAYTSDSRNNIHSIEKFCADYNIPERTFKRWIKWLKEEGTSLENIGIVLGAEGKKNLGRFVQKLARDFDVFQEKCVRLLNRTLFQNHRSPANSLNLSGAVL